MKAATQKARALFASVIEKFPHTIAADRARNALREVEERQEEEREDREHEVEPGEEEAPGPAEEQMP